jgi:hypothetical protein
MAVAIAGYHQAEGDAPGRHRQHGERGPALETRPRGIGKDGQKMIEPPRGVVTQSIALLLERKELRPGNMLLRRLNTEADEMGGHIKKHTRSES